MIRFVGTRGALPWIVGFGLLAGCYERRVPGHEIHALLSDSMVSGRHQLDGYSFVRKYLSDGTLHQYRDRARDGQWRVNGDTICIQWDKHKDQRPLCRIMKTDDRGHYWKELNKRGGGTMNVVTYSSFKGPEGQDRRVIPSGGRYWSRWLLSWRGIVVLAIAIVLLLIFGSALRAGHSKPTSFTNRVRRRMFRLKVGGHQYSYRTLTGLPEPDLAQFLQSCIYAKQPAELYWTLEILLSRCASRETAVAVFWGRAQRFVDETSTWAVTTVLDLLDFPEVNIAASASDLRFPYLLGTIHSERATHYQKSDHAKFEHHKKRAMEYFEHIRAAKPVPPPELGAAPYRDSAYPADHQRDYGLLVGAAYETLLYMNYTAPAKSMSSSSYSGGG